MKRIYEFIHRYISALGSFVFETPVERREEEAQDSETEKAQG